MRVTKSHSAHTAWSIQRTCDVAGCGNRQRLTIRDIFTMMAKIAHGGTRKEAAFKCSRCGGHNVLMRQFLPSGAFETLPTLQAFESALNQSPAAELSAPPAPELPPVQEIAPPAETPAAVQPKPVSHARAVKAPAAPPVWLTGKDAFMALCRDLDRALADGGDIAALGRSKKNALIPVNINFRSVNAETLLPFLDECQVELLVLGGRNADGTGWKTLFHPFAGMASLVTEPG